MESDCLKNACASRSAATATHTLPLGFGHAVRGAQCAPDSQILGGRRRPSLKANGRSKMDLVSKTPDENSGWKATDTSGIGRANSAPTPGSAILQSGIVAQSFGGQGDPSAISIIGEALKVTDAAAKCNGVPISATSKTKSPTRCAVNFIGCASHCAPRFGNTHVVETLSERCLSFIFFKLSDPTV